MKTILLFLSCFISIHSLKAYDTKIFQEPKDNGYILYAKNAEPFPVSVSLDLDLTNMKFSEAGKEVFVIPAQAEKFKIGELTKDEDNRKYKFSYKFKITLGDVTIKDYDKKYEYDLPFQKGKTFNLFQGYNGNFSHQDENALDFTMPEGTDVLAAREGVVVQVIQNNTESCLSKECEKYNNLVMIMHADGTYACYVHIKYNSAKFKVGDKVNKRDVVASSGNVGWSSGPHLHFVCFLGAFGKRNSLETYFKIGDGSKVAILKEGTDYTRSY